MIYSAIVKGAGTIEGQWIIAPQYTRVDGTDAPEQTALSADGIKPATNDIVLCVESRNAFTHDPFRIFDNNDGACPVIIAVFSQLFTTVNNVTIEGNVTLGAGSKKMVLGDDLQTWAQSVDAAVQALYAWAATGVAPGPTGGISPFPGTPTPPAWNTATLSTKHKLD